MDFRSGVGRKVVGATSESESNCVKGRLGVVGIGGGCCSRGNLIMEVVRFFAKLF